MKMAPGLVSEGRRPIICCVLNQFPRADEWKLSSDDRAASLRTDGRSGQDTALELAAPCQHVAARYVAQLLRRGDRRERHEFPQIPIVRAASLRIVELDELGNRRRDIHQLVKLVHRQRRACCGICDRPDDATLTSAF